MLKNCDLVAFVSVTDAARAKSFYQGVLGLDLRADTPFALVFDAHGTTLRVSLNETMKPVTGTVLGWSVPDINSVLIALVAAGVATEVFEGMGQDDRRVWTTPTGEQVAWFKDPDGNLLSVTQPVA